MNWETFHHRGDVLHAVEAEVNVRQDGTLPMNLPGVTETFRDELDLLAALQLRWYTRLTGRIDRELGSQPMDLQSAVITAWRDARSELPGVRAVLDAYTENPTNADIARALRKAQLKEHSMLAVMSGLVSACEVDEIGPRIGAKIEAKARSAEYVPDQRPAPEEVKPFLVRLRAALVA